MHSGAQQASQEQEVWCQNLFHSKPVKQSWKQSKHTFNTSRYLHSSLYWEEEVTNRFKMVLTVEIFQKVLEWNETICLNRQNLLEIIELYNWSKSISVFSKLKIFIVRIAWLYFSDLSIKCLSIHSNIFWNIWKFILKCRGGRQVWDSFCAEWALKPSGDPELSQGKITCDQRKIHLAWKRSAKKGGNILQKVGIGSETFGGLRFAN